VNLSNLSSSLRIATGRPATLQWCGMVRLGFYARYI
jgi:hypothetical protein